MAQLQDLCCNILAQHLHAFSSLDMLPDHLADAVRDAIQRDRRLLDDSGLAVWLSAVQRDGSTTRLNLRWASSLTDVGLKVLATEEAAWANKLVELDLGYCEEVSNGGIIALAPALSSLKALVLTGCTRCGDGACEAIGRHLARLERLELELLSAISDVGVQHIVRGCGRTLREFRVGGCAKLSNVSTSLLADHCAKTMRSLGLGGLSTLNDLDCEDLGRLSGLVRLELCACPRISDAGIKRIGMLAAKQMKTYELWQQQQPQQPPSGSSTFMPPPTLTHLDLGGLTRLTDTALQKLLVRTAHLTTLDLRGCTKLSADGLSGVFAGLTADGVQTSPSLPVPRLAMLTITAIDAATDAVCSSIAEARPGLKLKR